MRKKVYWQQYNTPISKLNTQLGRKREKWIESTFFLLSSAFPLKKRDKNDDNVLITDYTQNTPPQVSLDQYLKQKHKVKSCEWL